MPEVVAVEQEEPCGREAPGPQRLRRSVTRLWLCFPELFLLLTKPWAGGNELSASCGHLPGLGGCRACASPGTGLCRALPVSLGWGQSPRVPSGQCQPHSPECSHGLQQPPQNHSRACLHPPRGPSHSQSASQRSALLFPELLRVFQSNSTESLE